MKRLVFVTVMLLSVAAIADDITTLDGKTYSKIRVTCSDPLSVTVSHATGERRILFAEMDAELQKKFGYDAAKAAVYMDELAAKRVAGAVKQSIDTVKPIVETTNVATQNQPEKPTTSKPRISNGRATTVNPKGFSLLSQGMTQPEVRKILGDPVSTGMEEDGSPLWEYREYRFSWATLAREQVGVYTLMFKNEKLASWRKTDGPTFRAMSF